MRNYVIQLKATYRSLVRENTLTFVHYGAYQNVIDAMNNAIKKANEEAKAYTDSLPCWLLDKPIYSEPATEPTIDVSEIGKD